ncbi:DUF3604 domain-containing protein [bacterium]|nr:DUF3604 domain-containing protein [bacterium]
MKVNPLLTAAFALIASLSFVFRPAAQESKPPAADKAVPKAVAPKARGRAQKEITEKEAPVPLVGSLVSIKGAGLQCDLPASVTTEDGIVFIAYVEWDGNRDALRLAKIVGGQSEIVATIAESAVLHEPALAVDGKGVVWCIYPETNEEDDTVNLVAASWSASTGLGLPEILSDTDAAEAFVDAGTDSGGRVWIAWQSLRAGEGDIYSRVYDPEKEAWLNELVVTDQAGGDWEPELAFDREGNAWVLYDSSRGNEFNLYLARVTAGGEVEEFPVGHSESYEARGSIAATKEGDGFWIAAERGKKRWGLDSRGHKNGTGINAGKSVLFGKFDLDAKEFEEISPGPAAEAGNPINVPAVGVGEDGNPWLAYRYFATAIWRIGLTSYRQETQTWSARRRLPESNYGQDRRTVFLPAHDGSDLQVCWVSDGRKTKAHGELSIHLASLPSSGTLPEAGKPVSKETPDEPFADSQATPERPPMERHEWEVEGKTYGLYWGDFHRHTDISNCRTGFDGCIVDHFRYAYDLGKIDFLGTSDHTDIAKIYHPYEWWHNQRMHDALHSPGRFNTMYVYEREQVWPWGHRNVVFADRGGPLVYIKRPTYRASPWQAQFPVKAGLDEITPYELWDILEEYGKPVAVISHTGATRMGTDWAKYDRIGYSSENVVEIFQGARVSYEGEGAPQPTAGLKPGEKYTIDGDAEATPPEPILDFGKYKAGTYQNALELGRKLGVFASSDHISQHTSYGGVYCEEFTREGIIEALDQRRTIAATDKIYLNFTCNDLPLGSILETLEYPKFWFRVDGTAPIKRITLVRNEEDWKTFGPFADSTFETHLTDDAMLEGENRYYVRVEQVDGNMAWSSPVWVTPSVAK